MKRRPVQLTVFLIILLFTAYYELYFRSYLYKHAIKPSFIADSLSNFIAVLLLSFLFTFIKDKEDNITLFRTATTATMSMVLYEFVQIFIPGRVFDIQDILASVLGGIFAYLLLIGINICCKLDQQNNDN
ncbi:VanZ family protein [Pedobacter sp. PAMC26386]|nr:VanZ family protein [Pedobacter sp. PAMC26386]